MPADHDFYANAGPIKPCRSPTSSQASTEMDCTDQPDDQLQQGKRRREDQIQGERRRKTPCPASRSPNRKQEEGCHTTSVIDLTGEGFGQMNGADSDLSLRAELLDCKKEIDLWRKAYFAAKNHSKVNDKLDALQKRKDRQVRNLKAEIRWFRGRNKQLAQENKQLAQGNKQLERSHGSVLGLYLGLLNSQRTDQLMTEKNEHDESSAREKKNEEKRQRERDAEELKEMIRGINNVGKLVLEIGKQQSQAIRTQRRLSSSDSWSGLERATGLLRYKSTTNAGTAKQPRQCQLRTELQRAVRLPGLFSADADVVAEKFGPGRNFLASAVPARVSGCIVARLLELLIGPTRLEEDRSNFNAPGTLETEETEMRGNVAGKMNLAQPFFSSARVLLPHVETCP
ncbi:hypothetical protein MY4824_008426 [Beauveria thailandica]